MLGIIYGKKKKNLPVTSITRSLRNLYFTLDTTL